MLIQGRLLFEGGAYSKIGRGKEKTLKTDYLNLLTFLSQIRRLFEGGACSGAKLIRVNTVNHAKHDLSLGQNMQCI